MIIDILKSQIENIVAPLKDATSYDELTNAYWESNQKIKAGVNKMMEDQKSFSKEECIKLRDFAMKLLNQTHSAQHDRVRKETREKWVF